MKLDVFRKIIRDEVRSVIKEELSLIMKAPITETKVTKKPVVQEFKENKTIPTKSKPTKPLFEGVGALADVLNQTHAEGGWRNLGGTYNAKDAVAFSGGMPGQQTKVVSSVDEMIGQQRTSDINQVSIDAVPDFSGLMGQLKDEGKI